MEFVVHSERELQGAVIKLLKKAGARKVIAFSGEIGAGKTTFIQAFCRYFEVEEEVTSPTFALVNEYMYTEKKSGSRRSIYHLDLYRLETLEEALNIGIEEYLDSGEYCLIEWPEIIDPVLPEDVVRINLQILEDSERKILIL